MNEIKALPADVEIECNLLGELFANNNSINEVIEILEPNDFYSSANEIIFRTIVKLYMEDIKPDVITVVNEIGTSRLSQIGGITYVSKLIGSGIGSSNTKKYAEIIKEKSNRRKLIEAAKELVEKAYKEENNIEDLVNDTQDKLLKTTQMNKNVVYTDQDLMAYTLETMEQRYKSGGEIPGMRTGFRTLDNAINGLKRGNLNVIAARPSMGKTLFALNLADGLAEQGYKVVLFEMEMTPEDLGMRRLASKALIDSVKINRGQLNNEEWNNVAHKASAIAGKNNIFTDCSVNLSIADIKARSKRLKQKHNLDVIIIDHLTLMKMSRKDRRDLEVADTTMHLKFLAKELDVTIILLSQLNRGVEQRTDKRPMLSDLRESGAIEQDGDVIMFLYRDEYYDPNSEEKGILEVNIAKQRNGGTGILKFYYKKEFQKVGELYG
ncbi:replicative DNA helicase [Clostridium botulinum C]|uniref:Replicative DNA helicase n=1 Tax=Clostridium novyi B str. ATCC 27606 TaxID=1443123 RepID=A0AA40M4C9_CLONO|nr:MULTISPECIES: replicative DNA helicase [Clostridium]KEI08126.1 replicative DNA helicase [Clostridium novyi B str. NCTC 9691]KEI11467.1 replicative DNA helicase [Clostridium novyi B str. ATCC 27606]MCD3207124.1 replicative DNA helicase [Clostridium botulinum C]MCD3209703.1 replicative DNA helicase [Clostridium botulinum C]MCD3226610.1 replicative DNA helicase [Clostridium botulinum C]